MNDDFKNLFNNGDMGDEEFRREFMRIMNKRQREMDEFLKNFYGSGNTFNPFDLGGRNPIGSNPNINDIFRNLSQSRRDDLNDFDRNGGNREDLYSLFQKMFGNGINESTDEDGEWTNKSWSSPDGSMSFYSSSRRLDPEDLDNINRHFPSGKKGEDPITILKRKMDRAIEDERFEEAANYRDAIKALEEGDSE